MKIVAAILKTRRIWVSVPPKVAHSTSSQYKLSNKSTRHPLFGKARKTIGSRLSSCHAAVTFTATKSSNPTFHIHFCTFCVICGPKQMLPETDFHPGNRGNWEKPIRSILSETLFFCSFQDHWQRVRNRLGALAGQTLRKYVTTFVTHFRVNFLLHLGIKGRGTFYSLHKPGNPHDPKSCHSCRQLPFLGKPHPHPKAPTRTPSHSFPTFVSLTLVFRCFQLKSIQL